MGNGAVLNILPYNMLKVLEKIDLDLTPTDISVSSFARDIKVVKGILSIELMVGKKTTMTAFFVVESKSNYNVL